MANRYELLRKLGAGGMGTVFLARQRGDGGFERLVALKKLSPEVAITPDVRLLFEREVRLGARLIHPNVVQVVDADISGSEPYLATEFVDGADLESIIAAMRTTGVRLPPAAVAYICSQVCQALSFMVGLRDEQGAPLVQAHRDVSPGNILVSRTGGVKLADFGVARLTVSQTSAAVVRGKWQYFPPEISSQDPDVRGDLFALGIVLYQLAALQHPFEASTAQGYFERAALVEPARPPEVPDGLWQVITGALQKDVNRRYQTPEAMGDALDAFVFAGGQPMTAPVLARLLQPLLPPAKPLTPDPALAAAAPRSFAININFEDTNPGGSGSWQPVGPVMGADGRIEGVPVRPAPVPQVGPSGPRAPQGLDAKVEVLTTAESHPAVEIPGARSLAEVDRLELHDKPLHPKPPKSETLLEPERPARRRLWPLLMAVALALVAVGGWGLFRTSLPRVLPTHILASGDAPIVLIDSEPGQAEVYSGTERLGPTPLAFPNDYPDGQPVTLTVKKRGYEPAEVGFPGGRASRLTVRLKRAR